MLKNQEPVMSIAILKLPDWDRGERDSQLIFRFNIYIILLSIV